MSTDLGKSSVLEVVELFGVGLQLGRVLVFDGGAWSGAVTFLEDDQPTCLISEGDVVSGVVERHRRDYVFVGHALD